METGSIDSSEALSRKDYPCENCGALLAFKPGAEVLACDYCGHENPIQIEPIEVTENDLDSAVQSFEKAVELLPNDPIARANYQAGAAACAAAAR